MLLTSAFSLSIVAIGVRAGTNSPDQPIASYRTPASASVGTSGSLAMRFGVATASSLTRPEFNYAVPAIMSTNIMLACPPITSASAWPPPLYCTITASICADF